MKETGGYQEEPPGQTPVALLSPGCSSSGLFLGPGRAPGGYSHTPNNTTPEEQAAGGQQGKETRAGVAAGKGDETGDSEDEEDDRSAPRPG